MITLTYRQTSRQGAGKLTTGLDLTCDKSAAGLFFEALAFDDAARQCVGRFTIAVRHGPGDDRNVIPLGFLQQPPAARRQVVGDVRFAEPQPVVIDDIHIGLLTGPDHASIQEAGRLGRVGCQPPNHFRQIEGPALFPPIGYQPGRESRHPR